MLRIAAQKHWRMEIRSKYKFVSESKLNSELVEALRRALTDETINTVTLLTDYLLKVPVVKETHCEYLYLNIFVKNHIKSVV